MSVYQSRMMFYLHACNVSPVFTVKYSIEIIKSLKSCFSRHWKRQKNMDLVFLPKERVKQWWMIMENSRKHWAYWKNSAEIETGRYFKWISMIIRMWKTMLMTPQWKKCWRSLCFPFLKHGKTMATILLQQIASLEYHPHIGISARTWWKPKKRN